MSLVVHDLGLCAYPAALALQEDLVARKVAGDTAAGGADDFLLLVEHEPVYTLGRGADAADLLGADERLGVPVFRVSRGGGVTFHGPGQLVAYPILTLAHAGRDVHRYVRRLETLLLAVCAAFGIGAQRREGLTGVWVGDAKIASIGVGVRRWTTFHGIALNVSTDLRFFRDIVACRMPDVHMTSMAQELREVPAMRDVRAAFVERFRAEFGYADGRSGGGVSRMTVARRHPEWIKVRAPHGEAFFETKRLVNDLQLHTVCEEAHCPNVAECWGHHTATFMLLGDVCTRNCSFCAVTHGRPQALDPDEPRRVAEGIVRLGLRHVVVTSVDRDDLADGGAGHFAETARQIKARVPDCTVEVLVPDFRPDPTAIDVVTDAPIDILNHNLETVPRLYKRVRPGAKYEGSLQLLQRAKQRRPGLLTKTGLMLGLGEAGDELRAVFADIAAAGCDILTIGQYLRPSAAHLPVERYVPPDEFVALREEALGFGFRHVEAGPLVRSSYHAWEHVL